MLEEVFREIHNWFRINDSSNGKRHGTFTVESKDSIFRVGELFGEFSITPDNNLLLSFTGDYAPNFKINSNGNLTYSYYGTASPDLSINEDGHVIYNTDAQFLKKGQYFRIIGSIFNDGLYIYGDSILDGDGNEATLQDETFNGEIWLLAPPKAIISLGKEITAWQNKYADQVSSPYASESFGGYSYSKQAITDGIGGTGWQSAFKSRLNRWRKISEV